ncbi:MAG: 50S ribosomal protein L5 [Patescibacteria group bacterium]
MSDLAKKYKDKVVPKIMEDFELKNIHTVPRLDKVVVNVGMGQALTDSKFLDVVKGTLSSITGQKPIFTKAKKSISNFKIRSGMVVGAKVTLRGKRMYDFVDKLVNISLPRVRDFRGLSISGFDGKGNYTLGIKEHMVFPEMNPHEVDKLHGLDISIVTTATNDKLGEALLRYLGFPLEVKNK